MKKGTHAPSYCKQVPNSCPVGWGQWLIQVKPQAGIGKLFRAPSLKKLVTMSTTADALARGLQYHRAGDLERAEQVYRQILAKDPFQGDAWFYLGTACLARGRFGDAIVSYRRVLELSPGHVMAQHNLGAAFLQQNQWDLAVAHLRQAIQLQPDFADAYNTLGVALSNQGNPAEAESCYRQALKINPHYADAHNNLGILLRRQGRLAEAAASYREALRLRPNFAPAHNNLGDVLREQGFLEEAAARLQQALRLQPEYAEAHNNLGMVLREQGKLEDAVASFHEALRIKPSYAGAYTNLGIVFQVQGKLDEAMKCHREALRLEPSLAEAYANLGNVLLWQKRFSEALANYQQALDLQPQDPKAYYNLAIALREQGRVEEAEAYFRQAVRLKPDYVQAHSQLGAVLQEQGRLDEALASFQDAIRLQPTDRDARSMYLFCLNFLPQADPEFVFAEHCRWEAEKGSGIISATAIDTNHCLATEARRKRLPTPFRSLRVGYVSPNLCRHVLARFLEPILTHHDPQQVQAICYAEVAAADDVTARLRSLSHGWRRTYGLTDAQVIDLVRGDAIDILVDLAGHTGGSRLGVFACKPAPLQASYLGYPNTTGLSTIDYWLTDAVADPPGEPSRHTEELVRLPGGFCCYQPAEEAPEVNLLPALRAGHVTFGSLHKLAKLNAAVLDLWCGILRAIPSSRLLVFRHTLGERTKDNLARQFLDQGIPRDRLELRHAAAPGHNPHLRLYAEIDISLDPFPWSGHATACEALWMGVPVITLYGATHAGRMVASVLTRLGLTELITHSPREYLERAVQVVGDLDRLADLRARLRDMMKNSPLCDGERFTRNLEAAYRAMWQR
jgi:protein O-GlcNAc transferase